MRVTNCSFDLLTRHSTLLHSFFGVSSVYNRFQTRESSS